MLCNSFAFSVLDYDKVFFRSFSSDSINVRIDYVLSAVWQPATFKDISNHKCFKNHTLSILEYYSLKFHYYRKYFTNKRRDILFQFLAPYWGYNPGGYYPNYVEYFYPLLNQT